MGGFCANSKASSLVSWCVWVGYANDGAGWKELVVECYGDACVGVAVVVGYVCMVQVVECVLVDSAGGNRGMVLFGLGTNNG